MKFGMIGSRGPAVRQSISEDGREAPVHQDDRKYGSVLINASVRIVEVWEMNSARAPWISGPNGQIVCSAGNVLYVVDDDGPIYQIVRWSGRHFRIRARALIAAADGISDLQFEDVA